MRVRITATPLERELEGVRLDGFHPGTVRDVSPLIGTWLVAQGYAIPEMRQPREGEEEFLSFNEAPHLAADRRRSGKS